MVRPTDPSPQREGAAAPRRAPLLVPPWKHWVGQEAGEQGGAVSDSLSCGFCRKEGAKQADRLLTSSVNDCGRLPAQALSLAVRGLAWGWLGLEDNDPERLWIGWFASEKNILLSQLFLISRNWPTLGGAISLGKQGPRCENIRREKDMVNSHLPDHHLNCCRNCLTHLPITTFSHHKSSF